MDNEQGQPTSISVVIPSYKGRENLRLILGVLIPQLSEVDEIIVVDDCSPVNGAEDDYGPKVSVVRLDANGGVGHARNVGVAHAKNDIIAFFDDDVVPCADHLQNIREVYRNEDVVCAQGPHLLSPVGKNPSVWERADAAIWRFCETREYVEEDHCLEYFSGATTIRRQVFNELNGFSEEFPGAGGEEFEFARRLLERYTIHFERKLETAHRFKSLKHRLMTIFKRAQTYQKAYRGAMDTILQAPYLREIVRMGLMCLVLMLMPVAVLFPDLWTFIGGLFALYIVLDLRLIVALFHWRQVGLIVPVIAMRAFQYVAIFLGCVVGRARGI